MHFGNALKAREFHVRIRDIWKFFKSKKKLGLIFDNAL